MAASEQIGFVGELRASGYAVFPVPRIVELDGGRTDCALFGWELKLRGVRDDDIAAQAVEEAEELDPSLSGEEVPPGIATTLELRIQRDAVKTGTTDGRHEQAYELCISDESVVITANGRPGLFYGVQTLLQLAESQSGLIPTGRIVDWPEYEIRCIHLDTKHHQDRMETLKRYLDQAARFKINAILYEIEDKFEYPSHPIIGAPGAWTTKQLQEIVDYALDRHIQIIPDVQGPAHMAYVLKHDEFAHLRCDGSNYQICMDVPEARKLLFDMYDDLCAATQGCRFFHVSTDEVYYAGICEKFRRPYNAENRSLTWVDYVNAAHKHLSKKGREVIVWGEYPLLAEHVKKLPKTLINGIGGRGGTQAECENERGIRQFKYVSMQGVEYLFPNYFAYKDADGRLVPGRLDASFAEMQAAGRMKNPIGTITAAWDDSGLHNETFWLGWTAMAQWSWRPGISVEETAANFFDAFYGGDAADMGEVYRDLQAGSRFYDGTIERLPSRVRGPAYGEWDEKVPVPLKDRTMVPPALPDKKSLAVEPVWRTRYARALGEAPDRLLRNDRLLLRLHENLERVDRNRYNLEVYLSLAYFQRHFIRMLLGVGQAEQMLVEAHEASGKGEHERAVSVLVSARRRVKDIVLELDSTYDRLKATWEKSRFIKGRSAGRRKFVHIMDDVKDHTADRTADLSYIVYPERFIGLADWADALGGVIESYAKDHGIAVSLKGEDRADD